MGIRVWGVILFLVFGALEAEAQYYSVNGACTLGGQATVTQGMPSSGTRPLKGSTTFNGTGVMASYPGCTVRVVNTGTNTPAQIYSTANGSARSNPFTADLTDGSWVFFAAAACYDITISSGATQASIMPNPKTFPGVCAGAGSGGGGGGGPTGGTSVTVNGTAAVPNSLNFTNTLLPPANSTVVNFLLNGNTVGAYIPNSGGGGGATLPTTPIYDLFASTGAGAAQATGVLGSNGFLRALVYTATGDVGGGSPAFQLFPNASVEYFPTGYINSQGHFGSANGLALYMSHSGHSNAAGNGGVALGGGNSSGVGNLLYLDCEVAGCDFKVPLTVNGSSVGGGGGGGSLPTTPQYDLFSSTGSGGAAASGVLGTQGFLRASVLESTGAGSNPSPFTVPNGSIEYFPTGGYGAGGANGVALHVSHSGSATGFGGIALAGGNTSGVDQLYVDCEGPPVVPALGCDFKVPITVNGAAVGGGGGGSGTVNSGTAGFFTWYPTAGNAVSSNSNLDDGATTAGQITAHEPVAINDGTNNGLSMTSAGGTLPTLTGTQGGIGIGPGGVPQMNVSGAGWVNIPTAASGGTVNWGSIGGTLAAQSDLNSALNAKVGTGSTLTPTICTAGYAAAGILGNGNATGCFIPPGSGGGLATATAGGGLTVTGGTQIGMLTTCTANQHLAYISGAWACTSNSPTATALAATPTPCTAGQAATGILANGNAVGCFTPGGSGSVTNPITFPAPGSALAATTAGNGGLGVDLSGVTKIPNANGNWAAVSTILVNGNPMTSNGVNFGANTGSITWYTPSSITPPANGIVLSWGRQSTVTGNASSPVQAALIGNGDAGSCLIGTGVFATCPGGGGGGSGTVGTGTSGQYAIYSGTNAIIGSSDLTFDGSYIIANRTVEVPSLIASNLNILSTTTLTPVAAQNLFATNSSGQPYFSPNGATFQPFVLAPSTACSANQVLRWVSPNWGCYTPTSGTVTGATANGGLTGTTTLGLVTSGCTNGMVMQYNGTTWNCQTPTTGGGGVGTGTVGQFAIYDTTNSVAGSAALTSGASTVVGTAANSIFATQPITLGTAGAQGIVSTGATSAITVANSAPGQFGFISAGAPAIQYTGSGGVLRTIDLVKVNGTYFTSNEVNFNGTTANPPVCNPTAPTNGRCIAFQINGGQISAAIVGDGNATNCLNGQGNYVPCSGGTANTYTCTIAADAVFTGGNICTQALGATAKQWIIHCNIPWNFTGGSGSSNIVIGINLSATPSYQTYVSPVMWTTTGPSNYGAVSITASGNTAVVTANGLTAGTGGTIFNVVLDGTFAAAANTTFAVYGTASGTGTAAFRPGTACVLQ